MTFLERKSKFDLVTIYPVLSGEHLLGHSYLELLKSVLDGGSCIVQLREKVLKGGVLLKLALNFRKLTEKYSALLIINDDPQLANDCGADGVHLGQDDMSADEVVNQFPELLVGVSTHSLGEALAAETAGASYINIGPLFPTTTKTGLPKIVGAKLISEISKQINVPYTVMGGIKRDNIQEVLDYGARKIAVVTALSCVTDVVSETSWFINKIK